ncbi:hypothetical protein ACFL5Z_03930 [Planctomycetota bacterium]
MKALHYILIFHITLIVLASTNFTIISFAKEGTSFSWNYGTYSYRNGFGNTFVSEYSLLQIFTYLTAYAVGLILFSNAYRKGLRMVGLLGLGLCTLGFVSFLIEGSHWVAEHHLSWIASFPIALIILWILLAVSLVKESKLNSETEHRH